MKKLNRKGFTLVELLAVIVILAIVVGITLVTVLPTLKKSRQEAFELTAQTAADYFEKQYQLYLIGETSSVPASLITALNQPAGVFTAIPETDLQAAGLKPENYVYGQLRLEKNTGRACVELYASTNQTVDAEVFNLAKQKEAGEYYDANQTGRTGLNVWISSTTQGNVATSYSSARSSACS